MVSIGSFDFAYNDFGVILRGNFTYGHLTDSKLISQYNINTSQVSNHTRVGSDALAAGMEAGYDFFSLNTKLKEKNQKFYLFARYDYYDSFFRYNDKETKLNAWCGRQRIAGGINYWPIPEVGIKAEYAYTIINKGTNITYNDEPELSVGIVFAGFFKP